MFQGLVYKWHKRFSDGRDKDNERVGRPTLADERALKLVMEVIDIDHLLIVRDTAKMCDLKRTNVHCIFKVGVLTPEVY